MSTKLDIDKIHKINLETLVREAGSAKALAQRAQTSSNYLSQVHGTKRKGTTGAREVRRLGPEVCRKLELAGGKPPGWMDQVHEPPPEGVRAVPSRRVPLVSWAEAARVKLMDAHELLAKEATIYVGISANSRLFALTVRGDSMIDPSGSVSFPDGCTIIVDPDTPARPMDYVIVQLPDRDDCAFKQLVHDGITPYLKSLNPAYQSNGLHALPEEGQIIGVVVGIQQTIVPRFLRG